MICSPLTCAPLSVVSRPLTRLLLDLVGGDDLHPFVEAVGRDSEANGNLRYGISSLNDLSDGFSLEFRGESLGAHRLPPMLKA